VERAIKIRELNETINKRPNTNDNINYVVYNHIGVVNAATDKIWPLNLAEQQNVKLNKRKRKKKLPGGTDQGRLCHRFRNRLFLDHSWGAYSRHETSPALATE
jgi:hypothetical protein